MKYYKISILIYFGKAEFSAVITAVNSVTLSFRNHSVFYYTDLMFKKHLFLLLRKNLLYQNNNYTLDNIHIFIILIIFLPGFLD